MEVHSQSFHYWTCGSLQSGKKGLLSFQMIIDSENSPDYTLITWIISSNSTCRPSLRKNWITNCTHSPVILLWWLTRPLQLIKRLHKLFIYGLIQFSLKLKSMGILPGSNCSPVAEFGRLLWSKFQKILTLQEVGDKAMRTVTEEI